ncbi:hypothetical protein BEWA_025090 [Theileria equi strain WA]|uniref:Vacuolar protein 14 C-terminal Fig4-binding domain-containing protein n=1 Tax=Theileria equi strain WA TaxID=1537102 RepID=L0AVT5_THEEQ|nr:hypothetical protein BEWA_025090 [Theileria equi strain WA]AFZ79660.1 hypothetical protein BEWA_025090 [Theileria equi strain WA]|eukprot:XP_004829326.1 hypothetical protein BEWA_025090 [Theileria equi strain WA]
MGVEDIHEFLPGTVSLQIVNPNVELRKKGLLSIDLAVRDFIKEGISDNNDGFVPESPDSARIINIESTIRRFMDHIKSKFLDNPDPNYRIGGLMAIACTALALDDHLSKYADSFIQLALASFYDQDIKVRYYSCESLYNIMKKCKRNAMMRIGEVFDGICKLSSDPDEDVKYASQILNRLLCDIILECDEIPVDLMTDILSNRIFVLNPFIRQLIISWIVTLNSIPRINMIDYLPKIFLGLFNMLTDINKDVRNSAESCLNDFLFSLGKRYSSKTSMISEELFKVVLLNCKRPEFLIKLPNITWMREIARLQPQIIHFVRITHKLYSIVQKGFPLFLDHIMVCISDSRSEISKIAQDANKILYSTVTDLQTFSYVNELTKTLSARLDDSTNELVMLSILDWFCLLLKTCPSKMISISAVLSKSVILCFKHSHSEVIMEHTLRTLLLVIFLGDEQFELLAQQLLEFFKSEKSLLEDRGRIVLLNLCKQVGFERFYKIITDCMKKEDNKEFLHKMVHSLNWTLLTSNEAEEFRNSLLTGERKTLTRQLQDIWKQDLPSALSFALWTENYDLALQIVDKIPLHPLSVDFLVNLDKVVQLLDTRIFIRLRLHLLKPHKYPTLLKSLLGISMILPQNETNRSLIRRLKISQLTLIGENIHGKHVSDIE